MNLHQPPLKNRPWCISLQGARSAVTFPCMRPWPPVVPPIWRASRFWSSPRGRQLTKRDVFSPEKNRLSRRVWGFLFCRFWIFCFWLSFPVPFALYLQQFGTRTCHFAWYLLHFGMVNFAFCMVFATFGSLPFCMVFVIFWHFNLSFAWYLHVFATFWCFKRSCGSLEGSLGFHLRFHLTFH